MKRHDYALTMQEEMIEEIEAAKPKFIVFVNVTTSWLEQGDSEKLIFRWSEQYRRKNYNIAGFIDIIGPDLTVYRWDEQAIGYSPRAKHWLAVYRRKSEL